MLWIYYSIVLIISVVCTGTYIFMWHRHFNANFTLIFTMVPVACLSYLLTSLSTSLKEILLSLKFTYLCGIFLQLIVVYSIFDLCGINMNKWLRVLLYGVSVLTFATVFTVGKTGLFYKSTSLRMQDGRPTVTSEYGPMHTVFEIMMVLLLILGLCALAYAWIRNKQISKSVTILLVIPDAVCMTAFFLRRLIGTDIEFVPVAYVVSQITFLVIAYKVNLYNVSDTAIDSMIQEQGLGYLSCDFKYRYLGSNDTAKLLIPELATKSVDEIIGYKPSERRLRHFLDSYYKDPQNNSFLLTFDLNDDDPDNDRYYNVKVGDLYSDNRRAGYFITFTDDTPNRKYMNLIDSYNEDLKNEVEEKTQHIVEMHDNLIMSLATMVESRDNSTGGHIKRTSKGVEILVSELIREGSLPLLEEFCHDVIKAAPMHDLGKIAVDDEILRKPGRFTPEEFEKMKQHAAEGARVIHEILLNTDDESFKVVAENVAHYHHERWDGSGYPCGLKGEQIPLEARIMAVADVYDALVSKRVYKEAFDFAKADSIITEGMGTQFDPSLRSAYEKARPRLEAYYSSLV